MSNLPETHSYSISFNPDTAVQTAFQDPYKMLEWLRKHGPVGGRKLVTKATAPLEDWLAAGAGLSPTGRILYVHTDNGTGRSIEESIVRHARALYIETGTLPEELPDFVVGAALQEAKEILEKANREFEQAQEERRREKEEHARKTEEYEKERLQWVAEHGSKRLKKALDLGLLDECNGVYRDERLRKDYPEWRWGSDSDRHKDIVNPSLNLLEALEKARCEIDAGAVPLYIHTSEGNFAAVAATILGKDALLRVRG